jgi:hypothetical protein
MSQSKYFPSHHGSFHSNGSSTSSQSSQYASFDSSFRTPNGLASLSNEYIKYNIQRFSGTPNDDYFYGTIVSKLFSINQDYLKPKLANYSTRPSTIPSLNSWALKSLMKLRKNHEKNFIRFLSAIFILPPRIASTAMNALRLENIQKKASPVTSNVARSLSSKSISTFLY